MLCLVVDWYCLDSALREEILADFEEIAVSPEI